MTPLHELLTRARRRLRTLWLVATLSWVAPALGATALALVLAGRLWPWTWPEPAALVVAVAVVVVIGLAAVALRVPDHVVARAADRGLDTRDAFATALEVESGDGPFGDRVRVRAAQLGEDADLRRALPVRVQARRLATGGALGVLAVVAGVAANPQDEVRRQQAIEQALVDDAAEAVADAAAELGEAVDPGAEVDPAVAELEALAEALAETSTLEEAQALLDRSEAALQAGLSPEALARKAAVSGLEESLASEPLPGADGGTDAATQLESAAADLDELDSEQSADLAERLERLAETQSVGNPAASDALGRAAAALRSGDATGAGEALSDAAAAQRAAGDANSSDDRRRSALGAVGEARRRLEGRGEGDGQGDGQGQGEGQGEGDGQGEGRGQGQGQGEGDGQGQGQGQAGGSPSGQVTGGSGGTGAGQGGVGEPGESSGDRPEGGESDPGEPSVFDPAAGEGDEMDLGGTPTGDDLGEVVGRGDGTSSEGSAFVPLSSAVDRFRQRVTSALDDPALSPSMRELVRAYFGRLTEGS